MVSVGLCTGNGIWVTNCICHEVAFVSLTAPGAVLRGVEGSFEVTENSR